MLHPDVLKYIEKYHESSRNALFELLRIPSIANNASDGNCRKAADWLKNHLQGLGFKVELHRPSDAPTVVARYVVDPDAPTLMIYNHYDVQPEGNLDEWETPPFEPCLHDGYIYARGASDDKGQLMTNMLAVEAWQKTIGLPINVTMLYEGQEEVGSPAMPELLESLGEKIDADACMVCDGSWYDEDKPSLTTSLRGLVYAQITFTGPSADLHSGLYGGAVTNPINALARCIGAMHDDKGRIMLEGFYDDVREVEPEILAGWKSLEFDEQALANRLDVDALGGGEEGLSVLERLWARPTLDAHGIISGYTGEGSKTVIASTAMAKISTRLVAGQDPQKVAQSIRSYVASHTPPGIKSSVEIYACHGDTRLDHSSAMMKKAQAAMACGFGKTPVFVGCGASVPITELFARKQGMELILFNYGLPGDRVHSPNERYKADHLHNGAIASAVMMQSMSEG